jgi:GT2 family glycosyltransferase
VVRDGDSREPTASAPEGLSVRFLTLPERRGPAAARNAGWRASSAPLIAFTESDCRPSPDWLQGLLAKADGPSTLVQGRTEPDPDERHLLYGVARSAEVTEPTEWYEAFNILYPRALLEVLGGFDEAFKDAIEDSDLGLRARAAGASHLWAHEALVWHAVHVRLLPAALCETQRRRYNALLFARHPSRRATLHRRLFWARSHARLTFAFLAMPFVRRRPALALAAFAPYVGEIVDWGPSPRRVAGRVLDASRRLLLDSAELVALVRGSIRYRTLVL